MPKRRRWILPLGLALSLVLSCRASRLLFPETNRGDTNWETRETSHYFLYYRPNSETARDIEYVQHHLDVDYERILETLQVDYRNKINCYIYNSREDFQEHEDSKAAAHACPEFERIATYRSVIYLSSKHESTHVIVYWTIATPKFSFLNEGLAEGVGEYYYRGNWKSSNVHYLCKRLLSTGDLLALSQLADNEYFKEIFGSTQRFQYFHLYDQCASFVGFLIGEYGLDRFKSFYAKANQNNYEDIFEISYGESILEFETRWHEFLRDFTPSNL